MRLGLLDLCGAVLFSADRDSGFGAALLARPVRLELTRPVRESHLFTAEYAACHVEAESEDGSALRRRRVPENRGKCFPRCSRVGEMQGRREEETGGVYEIR